MKFSVADAKLGRGQPEPRGRTQVQVSTLVAGRRVTVKIGRYKTHNSTEYRITGKGVAQRSYFNDWQSALQDAIHLVEVQVQAEPGVPAARSIDGKEASYLDFLQDMAVRANMSIPKLLHLINTMLHDAEAQMERNENETQPT